MTQNMLFETAGPAAHPEHVEAIINKPPAKSEQAKNLSRVKSNIAVHVLDFCESRLDQEFTMNELAAYVMSKENCAPDSPSRILRALASPDEHGRAAIKYRVTNRAESRYRVNDVERSYA